ncbi:calmodulin-binding transcription activator 1-like [Amphibalanus amphitrite]|uniref:calmodulin-binding transcription activator 1-like n=1 Tax=Amphibalanus amphitrite TaxID=1232801 RepID=UPI001C92565A|nr:calmodulin-binding transcription activator 1-like [Amphibalanus amphitrite]
MDSLSKSSSSSSIQLSRDDASQPPPIPANLGGVPRTDQLPGHRHRWNTNEEIAGILINFESHNEWLSKEVKIRPCSGSLMLYSRKKVRYRRDGYCWKKRKDGKTTREDHMKLKVQGIECIYGCYVHSAILPTFHRRCYWLLQNPDIVLVHYLNVPYPDDNKMLLAPSLSLWTERKEWTHDELVSQLRPMFSSLQGDTDHLDNTLDSSVSTTVELIVDQLLERQRQVRSTQAVAQLQCGCSETSCCPGGVHCANPLRRVTTSGAVSTVTVSSSRAPLAAEPPSGAGPPLVLNLKALQGGTGYLLVPSGAAAAAAAGAAAVECETVESPLPPPVEDTPPPATATTSSATADGQPWSPSADQDLFKATFDLSLDDIQRTLCASMPSDLDMSQLESSERHDQAALLDALHCLDDFDFDGLEPEERPRPGSRQPSRQQSPHPQPESGPQPRLGSPAGSVTLVADPPETSPVKSEVDKSCVNMEYREGTANITDFSPEWAYPEGGIKVLVTGPWYATSSPYSVLFDGVSVPTQLVQSGVLRCFCPAHDVGPVPLQVACEGFIISNACLFEYKSRPSEQGPAAYPVSAPFPSQDDTLVKVTLMQRVQLIESRTEGAASGQSSSPLAALCGPQLEELLIAYCQDLMTRPWLSDLSICEDAVQSGAPSLLHLAALLGYSRLVCSLLHWRAENPSLYLESEVDAVRTDQNGDTPLGLTCQRGHTETARLLYQWNHTAIRMRNSCGQTPLDLAREAGHTQLADELERIDTIRQRARELDRSERVFARPGTKYRSELWRQRNFSLDLPSGSPQDSSAARQLRSSTPSPQRAAAARRAGVDSARSSIDSGLDTLRGERSASLPVTSPACSSRCSAADIRDWPSPMICESSPSADISQTSEPSDQHVLTLAEHIIAAMPERIKIESDGQWERTSSPASDLASLRSEAMEDAIELADISDTNYRWVDYRYCEASTPQSSASPASSCLPSPCSFSVLDSSPSPPPSAADLGQYFKAGRRDFALDFSSLTLSDREQRELYEAAKVIQKAYRSYKGRKRAEEQDREKQAAIVIQNCYRRYKQYFYYTQMTRAALVIQSRYRTYCEHKRFKKSQEAAVCIQNYYRQYKEQERQRHGREGTPGSLKRTYSQRRQHQAAMKIQNFMRQSKNNQWEMWFEDVIAERARAGSRKREAPGPAGASMCPAKVPAPASRCQPLSSPSTSSLHSRKC